MEELDLHWTDEDPDLDIPSNGVLCKDMVEIIIHITEVKDTVKKINLNNQPGLTEIPPVLGSCELLEELNISHTKLNEIPDFLFDLPNLRTLSCCCSYLSNFPKGIANAKKLEKLHVRINKDWTLPEEICSITNLKILTADLYSSSELPEKLGNLKNLEELCLVTKFNEGKAPALPKSFENHGSLRKLNIHDPFHRKPKDFDLAAAAKILSSCKNFESLILSGIAVGNGHKELSLLTQLKELELRHLTVGEDDNIFNSITSLSNLKKLDILGSEFKINRIPDIFSDMKELMFFSFSGNMITELPASIYFLEKLVSLEIGSTGISSIDETIGDIKTLERLQFYDNVLEKLPGTIFSLPKLKILNIEENIFNTREIEAIKERLKALEVKGQKVQFLSEGQGQRQMVKRLRSLRNIDKMDNALYAKYCYNAVLENPYAVKYVNKFKMHNTKFYAEVCIAAVKKTCFALENIDMEALDKGYYFYVCMEAAGSFDIGNAFALIKGELLSDNEYIQVCLKAALHNKSAAFIDFFNNETFTKRFSRDIYEKICWAAVLHNPVCLSKMTNPTKEIQDTAAKQIKSRK